MEYSGVLWSIVVCYGIIVVYFGVWWCIMEYGGVVWSMVVYYGV